MVTETRAPVLYGSDLRLRRVARAVLNNGHPLLKWDHMQHWHPLKVGVIGMPGSGKSGALAVIALLEDLVEENPVWANMTIHAPIQISDELAREFGYPRGGGVEYAAQPLDIKKMLRFEYRNGALVIDEINIKLAEARRSQANVNRWFNELDQQARKLHLPIYYSVIHEMWIDNRLRDMTDIFIKCEDPAFTVKGLRDRKRPGVDSNWYMYDMHGYKTGTPYSVSHKIYGPIPFHLKKWWGIWDTEQYQTTGAGKYTVDMEDDEDETPAGAQPEKAAVELVEPADDWGWLQQPLTDILADYRERGIKKISSRDLLTQLDVPRDMERIVKAELKRRIRYIGWMNGIDYFQVPMDKLRYDDTTVHDYEELYAKGR